MGAMGTTEVITLCVPTHWIMPVLYGDLSGLEPKEAGAFNRWLNDVKEDIGHGQPVHVGRINTTPYFERYHDADSYGVAPCECVDVDLLVRH